jgi:hypothetical protein
MSARCQQKARTVVAPGRSGSWSTARPSSSAWTASPISGKHNEEVQLGAFDILVEGGDDLRKLPLSAHDVMELTWPDDLTWPTSASTPVTHADVVPGPGNGKTRQRTQRAAFGGKLRS